ncbi:MAG: DUF547 domain-containing protein [Francisella endosymbiont of Hyalomma scupense]
MYNMLTIQIIIKHYPVKSITDIDRSWFGSNVCDEKNIKIDTKNLSSNDIEYRIVKPIWKDPRTHAALNCASLSCPNLSQQAYLCQNINTQLNQVFSA